MTRFVYRHPEQVGLGQHHAPHDLASRPAQPPEAEAALRQAVAVMNPTAEQLAALEAFTGRTMADLDMHDGTIVTHAGTDTDRGLELVEWTDQHGDARCTSVTPEAFARFFTPAGDQA